MDSVTIKARPLTAGDGSSARRRRAARIAALRRLTAWFINERRIRRGINELNALDDHLLADIGLSRGGIEHAVRQGRSPTKQRRSTEVE